MTEPTSDSPFATESPELERALDAGETTELPDNVAPGLLDPTRPFSLYETDTYEYGDRAGMVQENTGAVRWMVIVLLYLLVVTSPVAVWLLWRDKAWSRRQKLFWTAMMAVGYALAAWKVLG
jgi:hypothetical protein